jgi:hypothetical protein
MAWDEVAGLSVASCPHARFLPLKVRAFVDFLVDEFGGVPSWDA